MRSIGLKLFWGYIAMATLTVAVLWLIQAGVMRDSYLQERLHSVDREIRQAIGDSRQDYDALGEQLNISLIVVGHTGDILYRSQGLPMMGLMLRTVQAIAAEPADGQVHYIQGMAGAGRYAIMGRTLPDNRVLFAVVSLADVDEAARILRRQLWIVTAVLLLSASILAIYLSRRLSRPIRAVTAAAHELSKGHYAVALPVSGRDEIARLTQALNQLSRELQKTDQLRKELIANVSHDLRAPLAVIQGYAETVRDVTWPDEAKRSAQLTLIAEEAERLTRIVRDILDYSRLQAGVEKTELSVIPLRPLLEKVTKQYAQTTQLAGLTLSLHCPEIDIWFDELRLTQVLHNLIHNAVNHAAPDSQITITAEKSDSDQCRILIGNTGDTIAPADLARIWDRYYQTGQGIGRIRGTGLGLAIVKSILNQHNAPYGAVSQNDTTTFWFEATCAPATERTLRT